jgi:hypothetical protein
MASIEKGNEQATHKRRRVKGMHEKTTHLPSDQIINKTRFHFTAIRLNWQYQVLLRIWENWNFLALSVGP